MAVATDYYWWQQHRTYPKAPWLSSSPNLLLLHDHLVGMGMKSMGKGCYNPRPIRGGNSASTHAFGAALDIAWESRDLLDDEVLPWLISNSAELGVQRIHDYHQHKYWQAGKGWVSRIPGQGLPNSLHIETHPDSWADTTPIADRLAAGPSQGWPKYSGKVSRLGSKGTAVKLIQGKVGVTVDGMFGPETEAAVKAWQAANGLVPDGLVGPLTWKALGDA